MLGLIAASIEVAPVIVIMAPVIVNNLLIEFIIGLLIFKVYNSLSFLLNKLRINNIFNRKVNHFLKILEKS
ncbi:hypothetical protein KIMC2_18980 [Xylocopilactobacillus apis]|uniref:Uncharacterized protein n=1 Tax=Xylocopilactobacillus apis TaxID=2932183 RepID=A0AAU9CY25_9LACO|nr:hypothetical protein KIMC2_18980 [Xylocopilactobacillus apis]